MSRQSLIHRRGAAPLMLLLVALLGACGKGYDQEIIVQVFRPKLVVADNVTVEASQQGQAVKTLELAKAFVDCTANQLRIIPRQVDGKYPPVHIVARSGLVKAEADVSIPAQNPVKLVLGVGQELEPAACAPAGTKPDGGTITNKKLGEPCTIDGECLEKLCLKTIENSSPLVTFPNGYCSRKCEVLPCGAEGICQTFKNGLGADVGKYCLKVCDAGSCPSGLNCTPGNACMP